MIERVRAENGDEVLRYDGRLLASRIDPRAEARAWADARGAFLAKVKTVFVLGLGAGYHVSELLDRTDADVIVLEADAEIAADPPVALNPKRVTVEVVGGVTELRARASVRRAVEASYVTLSHPASRAMHPDLYRDLQRQLNGRDWGSLGWVWAMRGESALNELPRVEPGQPLTIYDLAQTELTQDDSERTTLLIKALRELVK